ncbi:MAG: hypothetical protein RLP14_09940 [Owenweeksia sp.]
MKKPYKVLLGLLFIIGLLWLSLELFAASFIRSSLQKNVRYYPSDTLKIGAVNLTYFPLGLELRNLDFDLHQPADTFMVSWRGKLSLARVKGLNWLGVLRGEDIQVELAEAEEGTIHWNISPHKPASKDSSFTASDTKQQGRFLVQKLRIANMNMSLERDSLAIGLSASLEVDSLWLNQTDSLRWNTGRVALHSAHASFKNVLEDYDLSYSLLDFDSDDSLLAIHDFHMKPRLSRDQFADKYEYMKVQSDITVHEIRLEGIDIKRANEGVFARALVVDSTYLDIYQDTRKERKPGRVPLPSQLIAEAPIAIHIDSLLVKRGNLIYHEKVKDKKELAFLEGDELNAKVFPISNIDDTLSADMQLRSRIRFMKEAETTLNARFFRNKPDHDFQVTATMGSASMKSFNPILLPMTGIYIKSGQCQKINISMYGNDYSCKGDMNLAYRDLKIALPANDEERNFFENIAEGLGNLVLVNTHNDYSDDNGRIYYERDPRRPVVNYWWKAMETGLKDALIRFHKNNDS